VNLATKTIVSDITSLLEKAKSISERYILSPRKLPEDLCNDLQLFVTRVKYIFTNTHKIDLSFVNKINDFSRSHLSLNKSYISGLTLDNSGQNVPWISCLQQYLTLCATH
jgi:hypothetical protein